MQIVKRIFPNKRIQAEKTTILISFQNEQMNIELTRAQQSSTSFRYFIHESIQEFSKNDVI